MSPVAAGRAAASSVSSVTILFMAVLHFVPAFNADLCPRVHTLA
jgi:hypothetical protein